MFQFDIQKWIPKFVWNDRNGHALAMAINAGLKMLNDSAAEGLKLINDYDAMPEWRLDELAWETNCLYDYNAPIETKRQWIKNALPFYKLYGTPMAIYQYLGSYFDKIDLQENWEYGGEPFHFRVTAEGDWTPENEAWARKAIDTAKNVRSVLDSLRIGHTCLIGLNVESGVLAYITAYPMAGEDFSGQWPQEAYIAEFDNSGKMTIQSDSIPQKFDYDSTGTLPDPNTLGVFDQTGNVGISADSTPHLFGYMGSGEKDTGTAPDINTEMILDETGKASMNAEATENVFGYSHTDANHNTGVIPQENMIGVFENIKSGVAAESLENKFPYDSTGTLPDQNTLAEFDTSIPTAKADDTYSEIIYRLSGEDEIN